jgi:glycosyltransferase involved in cell wall biosynthesis
MGQTYAAIIPVYNRPGQIAEAIASIQQQTILLDEIIVVDDASTDRTPDAVNTLARHDQRIRLLRLSANGGPGNARNHGIAATQCHWISFLDSDDRWLPHKHERQIATLADYPHAIAAFTGVRYHRNGTYYDCNPPAQISLFDLRCFNYLGGPSNAVVRRDCFPRIGVFDCGLEPCEDWDLWIRLREIGDFALVREPLTIYEQNGADKMLANLDRLIRGHHAIFAKILSGVADRSERRRIEGHHLLQMARLRLFDLRQPSAAAVAATRALLRQPTTDGLRLVKWSVRDWIRSRSPMNAN